MRNFFNILLLATFMFILVGCSALGNEVFIMADFPHYDSIGSLTTRATDVVRAEILDERVEKINIISEATAPLTYYEDPGGDISEAYFLYTIYRIRVLEVFKGNSVVDNIMEVKQIGGQIDDLNFINHDKVPFEVNDDLILFLVSYETENMPASLVNPIQSAYRFTLENIDARTGNINAELESVNIQNDLILTLADLISLSESNFN